MVDHQTLYHIAQETLAAPQDFLSKVIVWAALKGQCHEIFDPFLSKKLHLSPIWKAKAVQQIFLFWRGYLRKTCVRVVNDYVDTVSGYSQQIRQHDVSVVNSYADIVSAYSRTMFILCQCSRWLRGPCVSVVKDYADIVSA